MVTGVTLAFRQTPAYSYYDGRLPVPGLTTMQDQMVSGGMIWFLGSIVYVGIAVALLGRVFRNFESPRPPPSVGKLPKGPLRLAWNIESLASN